jgi:polar amino acid transport system substrate-binding protein
LARQKGKMMKRLLGLILVLILPATQAQTLHGYTEEFPPFNYTEQQQARGLSNEILNRISAKTGITVSRSSLPWLRAVQQSQADKNSVLYTVVRTPQREQQYLWVGPYDDCDVVFVKLKANPISINSLKDAERYSVGAARGAAAAQILQSKGFNPQLFDLSSPEESRSVRMLFAGRFDLSAGMLISHIYGARRLQLDPSKLETAFTIQPGYGCYFAFNPKVDQQIFKQFKAAFDTMKHNGELEKIRSHYIGLN